MRDGWELRLEILQRDVEDQILSPLRHHSWTINEVQGVKLGEYLIISVERVGHRHKVAVLYSSATDNSIYQRLAQEVEYIFVHGQLHKLESFTRGILTPVGTLGDFHSLLLKWNADSASGKFAPGPEIVRETKLLTHRSLLSETPIEAIWLRLRQFASLTLTRKLVDVRARDTGTTLALETLSTKAEGVTYAVRNAIDYFHAPGNQNMSQRVLNLYYGSMSFVFAEMLAAPNGPDTLSQIEESTKRGHGLFTVDGEAEGLEHIIVGVIATGFFPKWLHFLGVATDSLPRQKPKMFSDVSAQPSSMTITIEQLFARIPEISDLYHDIFESKPAWITPIFDNGANQLASLNKNGQKPTTTYGLFIDQSARLTKEDIANLPGPISQIIEVQSEDFGRHFRVAVDHAGKKLWWDALPLHHSPFNRTSLIMPVFCNVGEYRATCVVLLYALSIIVRYRPSIWRRVQDGDLDHLRILIEAFLSVVERILPEQFLERITGQRFLVKQPGSFC